MKASKAPSTGYCGIPALSISSLETSNGLLWMATRLTADNPNVWEVSTAWDRHTLTQDEIRTQLGIHPDAKAFTPQFYVASSGIRGVTAIAKRAAVGGWEYSPKSAEVVMNNILHLDKNTFAYLSGVPSMLEGFIRPGSQGGVTTEDTVSETPTRVFADLKTSEFLDRVLTSLQQSGDISGTYEGVEFAVRRSALTGKGEGFYIDGTDDYIELYDKERGTCSSARLFNFFNADLAAYPIEYSKWLKFTNRKAMPGPAARAICAAYMFSTNPESSNSVALQEKFNPSSNEVSGAPTEFTATVTDEGDTITLKVSQGHLTRVFSAAFGGFFSTPDVESIHVSNTGK